MTTKKKKVSRKGLAGKEVFKRAISDQKLITAYQNWGKTFNDIPEELDPNYMFSSTSVQLLSLIIKGKIDPVVLAKRTMVILGRDEMGNWVGFDKANKIHFGK